MSEVLIKSFHSSRINQSIVIYLDIGDAYGSISPELIKEVKIL